MAVRAHGLGLRYPGGRVGLESLELEVRPGEVLALLGPNGSGKSTLLRLLATDLRPTSGSLHLLGVPADHPGPALRRRIGYAADEPVHLDALSGHENLRLFLSLAGAKPEDPALDPALGPAGLLEAFALGGVRETRVAEYSFGMRRKLLLAQALAPRPELLLLDEPSVGLDPQGIQVLGATLRRRAEQGAAVVLATNEVRDAPFWADRILFLHQGRVLEDAPPETLLERVRGRTLIQVDLEGDLVPHASLEGIAALDGVEGWSVHGGGGGEGVEGSSVDPAGSPPGGLPGNLREESQRVEVESRSGGRILPALIQHLVEAGAGIREVRVREPDLGDLFRERTGVPLRVGGNSGEGGGT